MRNFLLFAHQEALLDLVRERNLLLKEAERERLEAECDLARSVAVLYEIEKSTRIGRPSSSMPIHSSLALTADEVSI